MIMDGLGVMPQVAQLGVVDPAKEDGERDGLNDGDELLNPLYDDISVV